MTAASKAALLEKALQAVPELLFVVDRHMRVTMSNKADFPADLRSGCRVWLQNDAPCEGDDGQCVLKRPCPFEQVFTTGQSCEVESVEAEGGRARRLCVSPIFDETGQVVLVVGQVHDVTQQRQSEREIRHYAAALESTNRALEEFCEIAEAASQAKSEFLANMSHEIRTPMTAILGFTETLLDPTVGDDDRIDAVRTIQRNGEHLLEILNDILDLSKIESGKMIIEQIDCSPAEIVADVQALMHDRARRKRLDFTVTCRNLIPQTIHTDPTRLRQILINLVGNAIKFTERGRVELRLETTEAEGSPMLRFDVIDTGIGMPPEQLGRLFPRFGQADRTTARRFGGAGLGLIICRRLLEELGGRIDVESQPGRGTAFHVWLPVGVCGDGQRVDYLDVLRAREEDAAAPEVKGDTLPSVAGARVLVAEDAPDNQRLICTILRRAGVEVTLVEDGLRARDAALAARDAQAPFDLVLMDMQMPELDGYQATGQLRRAGYAGPIVALTAHALEGECEKCLSAGCDAYARKPITRQSLLSLVARYTSVPSPASPTP